MKVSPSNKELIITYSSPSVSFLLPSSGDHALSQEGSTSSELKLLGAIGTLVVRTTTKLQLLLSFVSCPSPCCSSTKDFTPSHCPFPFSWLHFLLNGRPFNYPCLLSLFPAFARHWERQARDNYPGTVNEPDLQFTWGWGDGKGPCASSSLKNESVVV